VPKEIVFVNLGDDIPEADLGHPAYNQLQRTDYTLSKKMNRYKNQLVKAQAKEISVELEPAATINIHWKADWLTLAAESVERGLCVL